MQVLVLGLRENRETLMSPHLLKVWPTLIGLGLAGILLAGLAQAQSVGRTKAIGSGSHLHSDLSMTREIETYSLKRTG